MTFETSSERINGIGKVLGGLDRYLEIGVARGKTFFEVQATEKHAVDPRLCFDPKIRIKNTDEVYHTCTSDQYFAESIRRPIKPFDVIFLDGLHTYSQTLRDFTASQALSHQRTVWLIDDTVPSDPIAADPDLSRVQAARKLSNNPDDETWMGDVFKVIAFIDSFCPQFRCITTEGHGQTLILPLPRDHGETRFPNTYDIDCLSYVDLLLLRESLLTPTKFEDILQSLDQLN